MVSHPFFLQRRQTNNYVLQLLEIDDLQQLLYCQHQMGSLQIQTRVFQLYLKSGNGTLDKTIDSDLGTIDRCVWPEQVLKALFDRRPTTISHVPTDDDTCRQCVQKRLRDRNNQFHVYQNQYNSIKEMYTDIWTSTIEDLIQNYVQNHGIRPLQMKCDLKMALVHHDYRAQLLERYYLAQNPNSYQV